MARESERTRMLQSGQPIQDPTAGGAAPPPAVLAPPRPDGGLLKCELAFERAVFKHRELSVFRRNATTWEALLMIAGSDQHEGPGLYELVEAIETTALGQSALLRFLRERRDDGLILFSKSAHKRSKWTLNISEGLRAELMSLLQLRRGS